MSHLPRNDNPTFVTREYFLQLDKTGRRLPGLSTTQGWSDAIRRPHANHFITALLDFVRSLQPT
jgi:hypothetical protein